MNTQNQSPQMFSEQDLQRKALQFEALQKVSQDLVTVRDIDNLLVLILERAMKLMDGEAGGIYFYRPEQNHLEWVLSFGENVVPIGTILKFGEGLSGKVWEYRKPLVINNYAEWSGKSDRWPSLKASIIGVPVQWGDHFLGVLNVRGRGEYIEEDAEILTLFGNQAAIAIINARLHEETHRRLERLAALQVIDISITQTTDIDVTLNTFIDQLVKTLKVDATTVLLCDSQTESLACKVRRGFNTGALQFTNLPLGKGYAGLAALERRTITIQDLRKANGTLQQSLELHQEAFVSYCAVPLIAKGTVLGVLEVFQRNLFDPDPEWVQFLETLAGQAAIAIDNAMLFQNLQSSHENLTQSYDATIRGWAHALELRDRETKGHSERVTDMTLRIARSLGFPEDGLIHIYRGALLHDIGKMGVPDTILHKPGALDEQEWEIMRQHPTFAYEMLASIEYLNPALDIPLCHHEKWDGSGYPHGLCGEQIPLSARIFAIVDVWDALSSQRPYRPAWPADKVISYIREQAGSHFDPSIVKVFLQIISQSD